MGLAPFEHQEVRRLLPFHPPPPRPFDALPVSIHRQGLSFRPNTGSLLLARGFSTNIWSRPPISISYKKQEDLHMSHTKPSHFPEAHSSRLAGRLPERVPAEPDAGGRLLVTEGVQGVLMQRVSSPGNKTSPPSRRSFASGFLVSGLGTIVKHADESPFHCQAECVFFSSLLGFIHGPLLTPTFWFQSLAKRAADDGKGEGVLKDMRSMFAGMCQSSTPKQFVVKRTRTFIRGLMQYAPHPLSDMGMGQN